MIYSFLYRKRKLDVAVFITGVLGGLVGITAICAVCRPWEAFIIGFIGGLVACGSCDIIDRFVLECFLIQFFLFVPLKLFIRWRGTENKLESLRVIRPSH